MPLFLQASQSSAVPSISRQPETSPAPENEEQEPLETLSDEPSVQTELLQTKLAPGALSVQRQDEDLPEEPELPSEEEEPLVHTKLTIGQPNDAYEQEADRVADTVMKSPAPQPTIQTKPDSFPIIQRMCAECEQEKEEEQDQPAAAPAVQAQPLASPAVQRLCDECEENQESAPFQEGPIQTKSAAQSYGVSSGVDSLTQPTSFGSPIPEAARRQIEPVLGEDLSHVRVHTDPAARDAAKSINAKAYTHGQNIWLGPNQSIHDTELLAHESTHVVQQANGNGAELIQRRESGSDIDAAAKSALSRATGGTDSTAADADPETKAKARAAMRDPARRVEKKGEVGPVIEPKVAPRVAKARHSHQQSEESAMQTQIQAEQPPEPVESETAESDTKQNGEQKEKEAAVPEAQQAAALAEAAFAAANVSTEPEFQPDVVRPPAVSPMDAAGKSLSPHPDMDAFASGLAEGAQHLRTQGQRLRKEAVRSRANAEVLRGNIHVGLAGVSESEESVQLAQQQQEFRHSIHEQAQQVLTVSEEKAELVATEAPGHVERAGEQRQESQPMASESGEMAAENAQHTPEDEEAAADSAEQGEKLNQVSSGTATVDQAIADTGRRAEGLTGEAETAAATNEQTTSRLDEISETLNSTDQLFEQMAETNSQARGRFEAVAHVPNQLTSQANSLDQEALALIDSSFQIERELQLAQTTFELESRQVPPRLDLEAEAASAANSESENLVQRQPDETHGYGGRIRIDVRRELGIPDWLVAEHDQNEAERLEAQQRAHERRAAQLASIEEKYGSDLTRLSLGDRALLAIDVFADTIGAEVDGTDWPAFFGHIIQGFVDPRVGLGGILTGFSMILSGAANLLSIEQWKRDPLGNLLKSAADIATGVAALLGSIALLATAIVIVLTAIAIIGSIFSFGAVGAALAPIISFCGSVAATVGPWALTAAEIALYLQAAVMIKNLIAAAAAETAQGLQENTEMAAQDAKGAAGMAAMIAMGRVLGHGGRRGKPTTEPPTPAPARPVRPPVEPPAAPAPTGPPRLRVIQGGGEPAPAPRTPVEAPAARSSKPYEFPTEGGAALEARPVTERVPAAEPLPGPRLVEPQPTRVLEPAPAPEPVPVQPATAPKPIPEPAPPKPFRPFAGPIPRLGTEPTAGPGPGPGTGPAPGPLPQPRPEPERKPKKCPRPLDLAPGVKVFFPAKPQRFNYGVVISVTPDPRFNGWAIKYRPSYGRKKTSITTAAYDAKCNPTYQVPGACSIRFETINRLLVPARTVGSTTIPPMEKAQFVKAYPLCWSDYQPPACDPVGWDRIADKRKWARAHLINGKWGGPGACWNLVPVSAIHNKEMRLKYEAKLEALIIRGLSTGNHYWLSASVTYNAADPVIGHFEDFVSNIYIEYGEVHMTALNVWSPQPALKGVPISMTGRPRRDELRLGRESG